jgi:epoxyqueuosine reductase
MHYMQNHFEKRVDPRLLVKGARSVIVVLQNYYTPDGQSDPHAPKISRYAFGKDYHRIMKRKLSSLLAFLGSESGPVSGRYFVDSAPVLERALARKAGLGWTGKNSLLLNRKHGSFFFIGVLITDLELAYDIPVKDHCGDCTKCIEACPTGAIVSDRIVDSKRCISYLTIEHKGASLPEEFRGRMENYVFGCDICQDVCPWNNNAHPHGEAGLKPGPGLLDMTRQEWCELNEDRFEKIFTGSAVKRAKYSGLRRNIDFVTQP